MKVSVLYGILLTLIANGKASRGELSARYEISARTVQRYIDELVAEGVPVKAVPGKGGGYVLSSGYRLTGALLLGEDLDRIRSGLNALSGTFPEGTADEIIGKLTCVTEREDDESPVPRFYIDSGSWNSSGETSARLGLVSAAVNNNQTLRIDYTDKNGKCTERLLDPYSLALKEGVWYVYGWCRLHEDFRLFRLARMRRVEMTDKRFVRRSGGDVRAALSVNLGSRMTVELEAEESALPGLEEWLGEASVTTRDGRYVCVADVGDGEELVRKILSFGLSVRVLSPRPLIERVAETAEKIRARHAAGLRKDGTED